MEALIELFAGLTRPVILMTTAVVLLLAVNYVYLASCPDWSVAGRKGTAALWMTDGALSIWPLWQKVGLDALLTAGAVGIGSGLLIWKLAGRWIARLYSTSATASPAGMRWMGAAILMAVVGPNLIFGTLLLSEGWNSGALLGLVAFTSVVAAIPMATGALLAYASYRWLGVRSWYAYALNGALLAAGFILSPLYLKEELAFQSAVGSLLIGLPFGTPIALLYWWLVWRFDIGAPAVPPTP